MSEKDNAFLATVQFSTSWKGPVSGLPCWPLTLNLDVKGGGRWREQVSGSLPRHSRFFMLSPHRALFPFSSASSLLFVHHFLQLPRPQYRLFILLLHLLFAALFLDALSQILRLCVQCCEFYLLCFGNYMSRMLVCEQPVEGEQPCDSGFHNSRWYNHLDFGNPKSWRTVFSGQGVGLA